MGKHWLRIAAAFAVIVLLITISTRPSFAAADNMLGMAIMAAAVTGDGTLFRGSGAISAMRHGTGSYSVQFDRDVSRDDPTGCFFFVNSFAQDVIATPSRAPPKGVTVVTKFQGNFVDVGFYLLVYCAR
jgi:hypothetical protein